MTFHPVVVIGLGKNLLLKSVLGHCGLIGDVGTAIKNVIRMYWKMDLDYYTLPWLTLYVYSIYLSLCILGRWA